MEKTQSVRSIVGASIHKWRAHLRSAPAHTNPCSTCHTRWWQLLKLYAHETLILRQMRLEKDLPIIMDPVRDLGLVNYLQYGAMLLPWASDTSLVLKVWPVSAVFGNILSFACSHEEFLVSFFDSWSTWSPTARFDCSWYVVIHCTIRLFMVEQWLGNLSHLCSEGFLEFSPTRTTMLGLRLKSEDTKFITSSSNCNKDCKRPPDACPGFPALDYRTVEPFTTGLPVPDLAFDIRDQRRALLQSHFGQREGSFAFCLSLRWRACVFRGFVSKRICWTGGNNAATTDNSLRWTDSEAITKEIISLFHLSLVKVFPV